MSQGELNTLIMQNRDLAALVHRQFQPVLFQSLPRNWALVERRLEQVYAPIPSSFYGLHN